MCRAAVCCFYMAKRIFGVKTKYGVFECLFDPNAPERGYTVTVPKLKEIVTCGDTLSEAKKMAREAIELTCECLFDEGLAEVRVRKPARQKVWA